MEPKISGNSKGLRFPYEPSLSQPLKRKEDLIPRIVPAELNSPVPTSAKTETPKFSPSPTQNPLLQALPPAVPLDKLLRLPFLQPLEPLFG